MKTGRSVQVGPLMQGRYRQVGLYLPIVCGSAGQLNKLASSRLKFNLPKELRWMAKRNLKFLRCRVDTSRKKHFKLDISCMCFIG